MVKTGVQYSLFRIISRIGEDARVKPTPNAITAFYHNAMFVRLQELVVQEWGPLRMSEFTMAVSDKCLLELLLASMLGDEIFERIGKLGTRLEQIHESKGMTDGFEICNVFAQVA